MLWQTVQIQIRRCILCQHGLSILCAGILALIGLLYLYRYITLCPENIFKWDSEEKTSQYVNWSPSLKKIINKRFNNILFLTNVNCKFCCFVFVLFFWKNHHMGRAMRKHVQTIAFRQEQRPRSVCASGHSLPDNKVIGYNRMYGQQRVGWHFARALDYLNVRILCMFLLTNSFCLFVLRFYGPVNPMGSCRERSVYLIISLLGRLSPLSG